MLTQLGLIVVLAIINGFFSLAEMAVVTARKSRLKQLALSSKRARIALYLAQHPNRFLSAVQVGITLAMLLTGAVAGAALRDNFASALAATGLVWLAGHASTLGAIAGFIVATFIQIVVGELLPKHLALIAPERLACQVAIPMQVFARLCLPFVWLLNSASNGLFALLHLGRMHRAKVSAEEIRLLVAESAEQGMLDADERNMVSRVLRLGDRNVESVMTPRPRIVWLDAAAPNAENLAVLRSTAFSNYPVYRGDESAILGVVSIKHLVEGLLEGRPPDLFSGLTKPLYVPTTTRALDLLDAFRDARIHLALVVDEYGDIEGLVTLNDLLGAVIGKSQPGPSRRNALIRRQRDGSWLIDGALPVDDLRELLRLETLPHADEHEFNTLGGMLMTALGEIPAPGTRYDWRNWRFEVVSLDGARVARVRVAPTPHAMSTS